MQRSQPVQSCSSMTTIACPMRSRSRLSLSGCTFKALLSRTVDGTHVAPEGWGSIVSEDGGRLDRLIGLLRRRGIIHPAFEIHGGIAGLYDFGPVGGRLRRKVATAWLDHWAKHGDIVEIDSPTLTPESVLVASGHVGEFNDHISQCDACATTFRSDHLLEGIHPNPDSLGCDELNSLIAANDVTCPACGKATWQSARPMNLMFATSIGAMKSSRPAYLRPETAQGMFMLFPSLYRHFRNRLPFGAMQTGKGYRNEISPRQGMIRLREFNMAELEYFIDPEVTPSHDFSKWNDTPFSLIPDPNNSTGDRELDSAAPVGMTIGDACDNGIVRHPTVGWFIAWTWDFLVGIGIDPNRIRFRQHEDTEMAHYATDCWDCEIEGSYGWIECVGIAHRGCYDLQAHENATGSTKLRAWRAFDQSRVVDKQGLVPVGAIIGPAFRDRAAAVSAALVGLDQIPDSFPFELTLEDDSTVSIEENMVERKQIQSTEHGEWFTPHVVEPAFGIDRIIWHLLDHSFDETQKGGENYTYLHLAENIAPIDVVVLPLMEKDGMSELAGDIHAKLCQSAGLASYYDGSGSIGRRYARADEIGVPWAITVDHDSIGDGTVTIRRRDDGEQVRMSVDDAIIKLQNGSVGSAF